MSGYYALLGRGPSLFDIAQASGMTRMQRDARELQNQQLERQDRLDDLEMRKQESYEDKFRYDQDQARLKKEQEAAEARRVKTATVRQKISELEPTRQEAARAYADNLAKAGTIDHIDWSSQDVATPIESAMHGVEQPKPAAGPMDALGERVQLQFGLQPGTPEFQEKYGEIAAAEDRQRLARARAVGGAKTLPTEAVASISDADVAIDLLDKIEKEFERSVPSDNLFEQAYSYAASFFPNSAVSIADKKAQLVAQKGGLVLEDGKLQSSDFPRYLEMITPRPGESKEAQREKVRWAREALMAAQSSKQSSFGAAGYKVPTKTPGPKAPPKIVNMQAADARALQLEQQGNPPEKVIEILRAEGLVQ